VAFALAQFGFGAGLLYGGWWWLLLRFNLRSAWLLVLGLGGCLGLTARFAVWLGHGAYDWPEALALLLAFGPVLAVSARWALARSDSSGLSPAAARPT
jgi:hypothetical protein